MEGITSVHNTLVFYLGVCRPPWERLSLSHPLYGLLAYTVSKFSYALSFSDNRFILINNSHILISYIRFQILASQNVLKTLLSIDI